MLQPTIKSPFQKCNDLFAHLTPSRFLDCADAVPQRIHSRRAAQHRSHDASANQMDRQLSDLPEGFPVSFLNRITRRAPIEGEHFRFLLFFRLEHWSTSVR